MSETKRHWTWEEWQASRYRRRQEGKRVAPEIIRRSSSKDDARLREIFNGARGSEFPTDEDLKALEREFGGNSGTRERESSDSCDGDSILATDIPGIYDRP